MSHTPGPWQASLQSVLPSPSMSPWTVIQTPGPWKVDGPQPGNRWNVMHEVGLFYWPLNETEDNARAVAAVPDLLAACEMAIETFDDNSPGPGLTEKQCLRMLHAAIAKARGE